MSPAIRSICDDCDAPIAEDSDLTCAACKALQGDDCSACVNLCWRYYHPGCQRARVDWRARALTAEVRVKELEGVVTDAHVALGELWDAHDNGDVCFIHYPDEDPTGETYGIDCPEDDTCECNSRVVSTKLSDVTHACRRVLGGDK
jgi:hypothetical protein